jgi:hypothetical protein
MIPKLRVTEPVDRVEMCTVYLLERCRPALRSGSQLAIRGHSRLNQIGPIH